MRQPLSASRARYTVIPLLYFPALYFFRIAGRAHDLDFAAYYTWAYALRNGVNPYIRERLRPLSDWLGMPLVPANYPPPFILAFTPLTHLSIEHAFVLWSAINVALVLAAVILLFAVTKPLQDPIPLGAAALMYGPVTDALFWGQAELLVFFLLVVALWAMQNKKDVLCGLVVGVAALFKVYPLVLLGCFVAGGRKVIITFTCLTVAAGVVLSIAGFGLPISLASVRQIGAYGSDTFQANPLNFSHRRNDFKDLALRCGR